MGGPQNRSGRLEEEKISCPCEEPNSGSSGVRVVAWSLHWLHLPGSEKWTYQTDFHCWSPFLVSVPCE